MDINTLARPPYNCHINNRGSFYCIKYTLDTQWDSNYNLLRQCRGLILDSSGHIVHHGLNKFWNAGERPEYEPVIDWSTAQVMAKIDGSNVSAWCDPDNEWHWSSLSCVDCADAIIDGKISLYSIITRALAGAEPVQWAKQYLDSAYSYVFEVTSPDNTIVIDYGSEYQLWGITKRSHATDREEPMETLPNVRQIPSYKFGSREDCLAVVSQMKDDEEGYVVVTPDYERIKIKSPAYIAKHKLRGEGIVNIKRFLTMREDETLDDFLAAFPQHRAKVAELEQARQDIITRLAAASEAIPTSLSYAEIAALPIEKITKAFLFEARRKGTTALDFFNNLLLSKKIQLMEEKQ